MPGPPFWPFVPDLNDVARLNASRLDRLEGRFFSLEDARRPAVGAEVVPGDLDDAAVGREIAAEDDQPAGRLQAAWTTAGRLPVPAFRPWPRGFLPRWFGRSPSSRRREARRLLFRRCATRRVPPGVVQIDGDEPSARLQIRQERP